MKQGYMLIITEKPTAAATIARALGNGKRRVHEKNGVKYYEISRDGKRILIAPAVGHLFTLKQLSNGWNYPCFDVDWVPAFKASRKSLFSKRYHSLLKELANGASEVVVATDYDEEGEVIGYNIVKYFCNDKHVRRMRFSTLTKRELEESFRNLGDIDLNLVEAGYTRHYVDWYFGINFTRALTNALKNFGDRFAIISTGRVQGPTLKLLADREREISHFKPRRYWQLLLEVEVNGERFKAKYAKEKLWSNSIVSELRKKISTSATATVKAIKRRKLHLAPPTPYDTTTFLADAYRYFGYSPTLTMRIAENLYQRGYISYPRTGSQKLGKIDYKGVLLALRNSAYGKLAEKLLAQSQLRPNDGKKDDPAHPAIYPTTELPKSLDQRQRNVYDLVVRRFLACFASPAIRESISVSLTAGGEVFKLTGSRTLELGWMEFYGKYAEREEIALPELKVGDHVKIIELHVLEKFTTPPKRYTQGSILKEMEARGLGTKATRPQILQILYDRGYIVGKSIEVTKLGMDLVSILEEHLPLLISERLTRDLEEACDSVFQGKKRREDVLTQAREIVIALSKEFKKREKEVGKALCKALKESEKKLSEIGICPLCGGILRIYHMRQRGTRFVGCENYSKGCKFSAPLPRIGEIRPTGKLCEACKTPVVLVRRKGRRPFRMCLDVNCPNKWQRKKRGN